MAWCLFRSFVGWTITIALVVNPIALQYQPAVAQPVPPAFQVSALSYEAAAEDLEEYIEEIRRAEESLDLAHLSLAAIAERHGPSPEALFAYVRDQIRFEPYVGSLRGPIGVLETGSGNAIDQSLLLVR